MNTYCGLSLLCKNIKSCLRRFAKNILYSIVRNNRNRKKIIVLVYNFRALIENEPDRTFELFDYKGIINGKRFFYMHEYYRENSNYGIAPKIRKYAHYNKSIDACIEHGVYFGDFFFEKECIKSGLHGLITFSEHRKQILNKYTDIPVYTIGPYIHYADTILSEEEIKNKKCQLGRTLLFFPSHSVDRVETHFDTSSLISMIKAFSVEHKFCTIIVCLYWKDILLGNAEEYEKAGFTVVTNGYREDPNFLDRLKTFISLSDYTASNSVGTHVGYCISMGKGHFIFEQKLEYSAYTTADFNDMSSSSNKTVTIEENDVKQYFITYQPYVTKEQFNIVDKYWGLTCVKTQSELLEIFQTLE